MRAAVYPLAHNHLAVCPWALKSKLSGSFDHRNGTGSEAMLYPAYPVGLLTPTEQVEKEPPFYNHGRLADVLIAALTEGSSPAAANNIKHEA